MSGPRPIRGWLIDLDGVLCVGSQVIAGAGEALRQLADDAVPVRFLTNTTTKTAAEVASKLDRLGFDINPGDILSAVTATREYLIHHAPDGTQPSLHLLVRQSVMAEFAGFPHASLETGEGAPDYVVVGDIGAAWSYPLLNTVFNELMQGATLVAMHRNKFWQTEEGLRMDIAAQSTIRPDAELASVADLPQWVQQPHPSGN